MTGVLAACGPGRLPGSRHPLGLARAEFPHRYAEALPDPDHCLPGPFTLRQLRKVHEAVVGTVLHKDTFNRRMKPFLEPVLDDDGERVLADSVRGSPAGLYRRAVSSHA